LQKYGEIKRVFVDELLTLLPQLRIIYFYSFLVSEHTPYPLANPAGNNKKGGSYQ